jgi:orotidine-5'-phosphate decarboxylase
MLKLDTRDVSASSYMTNTKIADKIIVALDVATIKEALALVNELRGEISFFKVGLQLFTTSGPEVIREILATGARVFLDLKLHDIPNTVAKAVESAGQLGVQMLTIHLSGGTEMVRAAISAQSEGVLLVGVTLLTSVDERTLRDLGIVNKLGDQVLCLAQLGTQAGINALVASPHEVKLLRRAFGGATTLVVPGIRPAWSLAEDQKRVMTPRATLEAGADYLVIGRPVIAQLKPREAVKAILGELRD